MPASSAALEALGKADPAVYSNSSVVPDPALWFLTDILAMPRWLPGANVFSLGDVLIGVGIGLVVVLAMRRGGAGAEAAAGAGAAGAGAGAAVAAAGAGAPKSPTGAPAH